MSEHKTSTAINYVGDAEPRIVSYENGMASALVFDTEGDVVTIGEGSDRYFQDPARNNTEGMLQFNAIRDDGAEVISYVTDRHVVVVKRYPDTEKSSYEVIDRPTDGYGSDIDVAERNYVIGEDVSDIPGYARGGMTLVAVAAEYKGGVGNVGEQKEGKSPFEVVRQMLDRRQQRKAVLGSAAIKTN